MIKEGATHPPLEMQITDRFGRPYNLKDATVRVVIAYRIGAPRLVDAIVEITDEENGWIKYQWKTGETKPGDYHVQVDGSYPDGRTFRAPADGFEEIKITESL